MKKRKFLSFLVILSISFCLTTFGDEPQVIAIRAGKIWTVSDGVITDGTIIVKDGKIQAVGENVNIPEGAKVLDMSDKNVMPGMIDAHCHIGLSLDILSEKDETVEAVAADMQILDAFNPHAQDIKKALRSGVTTIMLAPGYRNPVGGQPAVLKLDTSKANEWVLKRTAGVEFSLMNEALMFDREPTSRAGLLELIRAELDEAKASEDNGFNPPREVLKRVVDAKMLAYIWVHTVDEIASAMTIIDEYNLDAVLVAAVQGDEVADMIAERDLPVIYPPLFLFSKNKDLKRAGKIADSGVKLAFASLAPDTDISDLRTSAILAVKYGLDKETALKSLTINAAEILGVADRLGSISEGKDADLVILDGDPLQLASGIEMVIINGNIVYQGQEE
ncbi:MAG: amidohydrolase family protein [Planctomycetota bacterium]